MTISSSPSFLTNYSEPFHAGALLSEAYSLESYAEYKGYKISIAREVGDEYELYLSDYELAQKLGFDRCDKCGYNLMIKKTDVEVIIEKKPLDL